MKKPVIEQLDEFFSRTDNRGWLRDDFMDVSVRKVKRLHPVTGKVAASLDLTNIVVREGKRRQGHATRFINEAHHNNPFDLTYIETVSAKRFIGHLVLMGYIPVLNASFLVGNMILANASLYKVRR